MNRPVFIAIAFSLTSWFTTAARAAEGPELLKCAAWLTGESAASAVNSYFSEWMALRDLVDERVDLAGLLDGVELSASPEVIQTLIGEIQSANAVLMTNGAASAAFKAAVETISRLEPQLRSAVTLRAKNPNEPQFPSGKRARSTFRHDDLGSEDDLKY